jgi:hypothetical protein
VILDLWGGAIAKKKRGHSSRPFKGARASSKKGRLEEPLLGGCGFFSDLKPVDAGHFCFKLAASLTFQLNSTPGFP